jgi:glycosyltransferase involved in cell wall biosynthesis
MISVIVPTYNDGENLMLAIQSIQDQTYKDIEIIVVDDFSTDNTETLVKDIARKDNRVKYFLNNYNDHKRFNNKGVNINAGYSARNFGLSKAKGEFITFQDGDDISLLNRLEIQLMLLKKYNVSHLTTSVIWNSGKYIGKRLNFNQFKKEFNIEEGMLNKEYIYNKAKTGIGLFYKILPKSIWSKVPFELKQKRLLNRLFFGHPESYPGGGNNPFFKKVLCKKVKFRQLDYRVWPSLKGRGADRDFNYNLSYSYKDSLFVDIPLYCWSTPTPFNDKYDVEKFLI